MQEWREAIQKGLDQVKEAPDWKQANRANHDQMRAVVAELRQKIRVHREEFQLSFLTTNAELEKDLKDFLAPIEEDFAPTNPMPIARHRTTSRPRGTICASSSMLGATG